MPHALMRLTEHKAASDRARAVFVHFNLGETYGTSARPLGEMSTTKALKIQFSLTVTHHLHRKKDDRYHKQRRAERDPRGREGEPFGA